ncbi:THAP domain-containing protein 10 [Exaiptasia diaphana]|nr:THAP domain-containing protein 10 [Exaiptasia diaphana]
MPSSRCVVQASSNKSLPKEGNSHHNSPQNQVLCAKWKKFVRTHRKNFDPSDRFVICSNHFEDSCFTRTVHVEGSMRRLIPGSIPTIWKRGGERAELYTRPNSRRDHRMIGTRVTPSCTTCTNLSEDNRSLKKKINTLQTKIKRLQERVQSKEVLFQKITPKPMTSKGMQTDFEEEFQPVDCPMEEIASNCEEDDPLWDPADESASPSRPSTSSGPSHDENEEQYRQHQNDDVAGNHNPKYVCFLLSLQMCRH